MDEIGLATNDTPAAAGDPGDDVAARVAVVAAELRARLGPLVNLLAGTPPRPIRLTRGLGVDKSLASRIVQATRAPTDLEFLHAVPSPTGLRILLDLARGHAEAALLRDAGTAADRFEALLDALPGGRQALDAHMGETAATIRAKREQIARQASFKAVSFLFGHYCETLTTSLFLLPGTNGKVDSIEVHRRIGLQRLTPSTPLPLLSIQAMDPALLDADAPRMTSLAGDAAARDPRDFLIAEASSTPLPELSVVQEGSMTTFVLDPASTPLMPDRITSAFAIRSVDTVAVSAAFTVVRSYMVHTPCHRLVRDVFLADGLWPDALPEVAFWLPGPSGSPAVMLEPGKPHHRQVNLTARIEQLPRGAAAFDVDGVADQRAAVEAALRRAGADAASFRGWRCSMAYPVPLIEMQLALRFGGRLAAEGSY
ncbi:MAG: hypothetical protein JSR59_15560 [Proteobacteria bacterium]|nr:hypothetical protein [Pseudomonadota bacterium]